MLGLREKEIDTLKVELTIAEHYHLQSHTPAPGLTATVLTVPEGATVDYPKAAEKRFPFADAPVAVYEGIALLIVHFPAPPTPAAAVKISLTYQACDDRACLPAVTKTMEVAR